MKIGATSEYLQYFDALKKETGCENYLFSTTPLVLERQFFDQVNTVVAQMLDLIDTPEYFEHCLALKNWRLPPIPMSKEDFFGCSDFLLTKAGAKLIEMNINMPGKVGLMQRMGEATKNFLRAQNANWTNLDFNEILKTEIEKALPDAKNIAILISHFPASEKHVPHYTFFSNQLNEMGFNTTVVYANQIQVEKIGFSAQNQTFDGVINLVIPFVWEDNIDEFVELTKLLVEQPNSIFPCPSGGMLGTKDLLNYLSQKANDHGSEDWKDFVLRAYPLNSFNNLEELNAQFHSNDLVLKPFKDYDTKGVYVQPDPETVRQLLKDKKESYMVQEYTESLELTIQNELGESLESGSVIYRIFFASKKAIAYQAYYVIGKFNGTYYSAPVLVK